MGGLVRYDASVVSVVTVVAVVLVVMVGFDVMTFPTLLRRLLKERYPSIREFARALKVDPSHLSRAMNRKSPQPFDVRGCLRLAEVTGEDPLMILRAAGKSEIADLLERVEVLTKRAGRVLSPEQIVLADAYEVVSDQRARTHSVEQYRRWAATYRLDADENEALR
jgi:transcriptional regulator with XRE-family HTH domain